MVLRPPRSTRTDTLCPTRRSSDLAAVEVGAEDDVVSGRAGSGHQGMGGGHAAGERRCEPALELAERALQRRARRVRGAGVVVSSEEHTSELQSLMRISYAVFCVTKKKKHSSPHQTTTAQTA